MGVIFGLIIAIAIGIIVAIGVLSIVVTIIHGILIALSCIPEKARRKIKKRKERLYTKIWEF